TSVTPSGRGCLARWNAPNEPFARATEASLLSPLDTNALLCVPLILRVLCVPDREVWRESGEGRRGDSLCLRKGSSLDGKVPELALRAPLSRVLRQLPGVEEGGEHEVGDDDRDDRLDHRVGGGLTDACRAAAHFQPVGAGDGADQKAED